ncbi:hypothetical protein [Rhodococcus sp. RDE2]|uniref:hypothetical protein n=1 Tax=Rhodococcus sp. RDE2 TaxID=2885078 RepID=UPI001E5337DD|nr:hypothetical protein [Rhodococcus sp. RDE2]BDB62338.1 hypothetical protein RDE2_41320 [Rhodococcus sp. RDE2]
MDTLSARRITTAITLSIAVACASSLVIAAVYPSMHPFAASGLAKRFTLPVSLVAFGIALLLPPTRGRTIRYRFPGWWTMLVAVGLTSSFLSATLLTDDQGLFASAKAAGLYAGFLLAAAAGLTAGYWTDDLKARLTWVLIIGGLVSAVLARDMPPFVAIAAPAGFGALYLAARNPERRARLTFLGIVILGLTGWRIVNAPASHPPSIALITSLLVCGGFLLLLVLPRSLRLFAAFGAAIYATWWMLSDGTYRILFGAYRFEDVTIAQRGYETNRVLAVLDDSPLALLFGMGPGASVDLSMSPDRVTLLSSGRTLGAVDDVHLLTSYVLLKFGLFGLLWLGILLWQVVKLCVEQVRDPDPWRVTLLLFVLSGTVAAIPAATYFFSNPLPALCLGILVATRATNPEGRGHTATSRVESVQTGVRSYSSGMNPHQ